MPKEMTPDSLPEELPPQIWNNWPSNDNAAFEMPEMTASEIDWVRITSNVSLRNH